MAFPSAAGHNNLPNGVFSPTIFSKKAQKRFRKSSTVSAITNSLYFGEIAQAGDSVKIIKEPTIQVHSLARGTTPQTQDLEDKDYTLIVDQAHYFQFGMDDIEKAHAHVDWIDLASDEAGYQMRDAFDREVLGYLSGWEQDGAGVWIRRTTLPGTKADDAADNDELLAAHKLDITNFGGADLGAEAEVTSIPVASGGGVGAVTSPLQILNRFNRIMDQNNVPTEGRWVVVDPVFVEMLLDEDSKLVNADFGGNGQLFTNDAPHKLRNLRVYKSNNLPFIGTGAEKSASSGSETDFSIITAGHDSAVATAEQLTEVEKFRNPNKFGDLCRGMHVYGRKILRPEGLFTAAYNVA